ncbi:MAG: hypothetical protein AAGJ46_15950 [Planctomycetota bacterium]
MLNPSRSPFFTLSELVAAWTEKDADDDTLRNRRRVVRRNTIDRGCPHVPVGNETVFVTTSFIQWLLDNEERTNPESE